MTPNLPRGWVARGDLPDVVPTDLSNEILQDLDEDLLQIVDPSGELILDVGWYPSGRRDGEFKCRAVVSGKWDAPIEEYAVRDSRSASTWLESWIHLSDHMLGAAGQFEQAVGVRDAPDVPVSSGSTSPGDPGQAHRSPDSVSGSTIRVSPIAEPA